MNMKITVNIPSATPVQINKLPGNSWFRYIGSDTNTVGYVQSPGSPVIFIGPDCFHTVDWDFLRSDPCAVPISAPSDIQIDF